jgi:hypothetical protein
MTHMPHLWLVGNLYLYVKCIHMLNINFKLLVRASSGRCSPYEILQSCCTLRGFGGERIVDVVPGGTELELQLRRGVG